MIDRSNQAQKFYSVHVRSHRRGENEPEIIRDVVAWLRRARVPEDDIARVAGATVEAVAYAHHEHEACDTLVPLLSRHVNALLAAERSAASALADFLSPWTYEYDAAFLDVACGNGFLLADEMFDGADCAQFDHADVRASFARGPGLTFHSTWTDVTRDAKKNGDFDVAFLWDVLRCAHTPFNEVVRVRAVARRLAIVEAVTNSTCRPRSTQSLAVIDWLRTRVLFPDRTFVHHGRYQALEDWRHLLRRANASIVTECAIPEGTLSVPGDHRLFVCDVP